MLNKKTKPGFRNDINGLRAFAVTLVILFHFGIPGFSGGYIGVDVFFVISGYLMTRIIVSGLRNGNFSTLQFYVARARRIIPALIGLCLSLLALGWLILPAIEYKTLGSHTAYALTFISNIEFWLETGYFDATSNEKWLLHTWSLSIEWQFYLILPIILRIVWKISECEKSLLKFILFIFICSLSASIFITYSSASTAFFLLHTRAWEMLAGGIVFLLSRHITLPPRQKSFLHFSGLALMLASGINLTHTSLWPGYLATLPVLSACLIIIPDRASIFTNNNIAQWLGTRSYSLYLWHWPIYVLLNYAELNDNNLAKAGAILLTIFVGNISFLLFEKSARIFLEKISTQSQIFLISTFLFATISISTIVWTNAGILNRLPEAADQISAGITDPNLPIQECNSVNGKNPPTCFFGNKDISIAAVGDSHAQAVISAIASPQNHIENPENGVVAWIYHGCPFVLGLKKTTSAVDKHKQCPEFIVSAQNRIKALPTNIPLVIINNYGSAFGHREGESAPDIPIVYFSKIFTKTSSDFITEYSQHITDTACEMAKQRKVYLLRPIPEMAVNVPKALSRRIAMGRSDDIKISVDQYRKRNMWVWVAQDAARDKCGVQILDTTKYLCDSNQCFGSINGTPLYYDNHHLNEAGRHRIAPMFLEILKTQ